MADWDLDWETSNLLSKMLSFLAATCWSCEMHFSLCFVSLSMSPSVWCNILSSLLREFCTWEGSCRVRPSLLPLFLLLDMPAMQYLTSSSRILIEVRKFSTFIFSIPCVTSFTPECAHANAHVQHARAIPAQYPHMYMDGIVTWPQVMCACVLYIYIYNIIILYMTVNHAFLQYFLFVCCEEAFNNHFLLILTLGFGDVQWYWRVGHARRCHGR